ncbi:MAG: D-alanyl-D-alanine carboxypeptidase [Clostridia bacterium]|nr:D-alanyl-D-alanine carboxypeptidase [Clostridia bacterium]
MKRILIFVIAVIMTLSVAAQASASVMGNAELNVASKYAALICYENGQLMTTKDAETPTSPAAGVKLMTALLVYEYCEENNIDIKSKTVIIPKFATEGVEGTYNIGLKKDEELTVEQLLYALLVSNANDVAKAFAYFVTGDENETEFVRLMNARAAELGMTATTFVNCTGYDAEPNNVTTALDMTKLLCEFYSKDAMVQMTRVARYTIPQTNKTPGTRNLNNKNHLVSTTLDSNYYHKGAIGLMYTYSESAGHCTYTAFEINGLTYLAVLMGSEMIAMPGAPVPIIGSLHDFKNCYSWCQGFEYRELISDSKLLGEIPVTLASTDGQIVTYHPEKTIEMLVKVESFDETKIKIVTEGIPEQLEAPIEKNQVVGTFKILYDGEQIGSGNLVLTGGVDRDDFVFILRNIKEFMLSDTMKNGVLIFIGLIVLYIVLGIVLKIVKLVKRIKRRRARKAMIERRRKEGKPIDPYYDDYYYDDDDDYYE